MYHYFYHIFLPAFMASTPDNHILTGNHWKCKEASWSRFDIYFNLLYFFSNYYHFDIPTFTTPPFISPLQITYYGMCANF